MLAFVLLLAATTAFADDVILTPNITTGNPVGIVWIQGADIPAASYASIATTLQSMFPNPLFIGIPEFPLSVPEPLVIGSGVKRVLASLQSAGLPANSPIFAVGHSLGGAMIQDYVQSNAASFAGMVLHGSALVRKYNTTSNQFKVPTLTVAGELDGLFRIFRAGEAYWRQVLHNTVDNAAVVFPVVKIAGMCHMQFASGTPPPFVKSQDLVPEITEDSAHQQVAAVMVSFILTTLTGQDSYGLSTQVQNDLPFFTPIIDALTLEGFYHFEVPCYCKGDVDPVEHVVYVPCPVEPYCARGGQWVQRMMQAMGGLTNVTIDVIDSFNHVDDITPIHLPHIFNNCSDSQDNCTLQISTRSDNMYDTLDPLDTGSSHTSAYEIRAKLMSRQAVYAAGGVLNPDFNVLDGPSLCAQLNQLSIDYAETNAGSAALARYSSIGLPMQVADDDNVFGGPLWIYQGLKLTQTSSALVIQSIAQKTSLDFPIQLSAGFHYCKLLSPARALEWIYIDSIRPRSQ